MHDEDDPQPGPDGGWDAAPVWTDRLGTLRNVVRQELVTRQLREVLGSTVGRALDVGAGQGTQGIRLARRGWQVVAWEPDPAMRAACTRALAVEAATVRDRLRVVAGDLAGLATHPPGDHDLVLCHGVLMYLDDPAAAVAALARQVTAGGHVSILARNARGLALRPARRGRWTAAAAMLAAVDAAVATGDRPRYVNELGASCWADDVDHLASLLWAHGLGTCRWFGVRLAVDGVDPTTPVPDDAAERATMLDVEESLGRDDAARHLAPLFHLVARRDG